MSIAMKRLSMQPKAAYNGSTATAQEAVAELAQSGAHVVLVGQGKIPCWPPRGGLSGKEVYPAGDKRAGQLVSAGTGWTKHPATVEAIRAHRGLFGIVPATVGVLCIDVDDKHPVGVDAIREAVVESQGAPAFAFRSRSDGFHLYYKADPLPLTYEPYWFPGECAPKPELGEVRYSGAQCVLWDFAAFCGGLEGLDDCEPVDARKWPIADAIKKPSEGDRKWIQPYLQAGPDAIIAALAETGIYGTQERNWTRFDAADIGCHEPSGKNSPSVIIGGSVSDPDSGVTVYCFNSQCKHNAFRAVHKLLGWKPRHGGAREGAGRPPLLSPSSKTVQNQRALYRTELRNWAFEVELPRKFWLDDLIDADATRVLEFQSERFATDGNSSFIAMGATWLEFLPHSPQALPAVAEAIRDARGFAADSLCDEYADVSCCYEYAEELRNTRLSGRHTRDVRDTLLAWIPTTPGILHSSSESFDDRNRRPLLPLEDGGALDLTEYPPQYVKSTDALSAMMLYHGWSIPMPDFAVLSDRECPGCWAIHEHFGTEVFDRLATYLLGIDKSLDTVLMQSDAGKSTLVEILKAVFPGAVGTANATGVFAEAGQRFTPLANMLATKLFVFVDEVGHEGIEIRPAVVNELVQETISHEAKGKDRKTVHRIGSLCFLGFDYPNVDSTAQGFASRFRWAAEKRQVDKMTREQREAITSPESIAYIRAWLIDRAAQLRQEHGGVTAIKEAQCDNEAVRKAIAEFAHSRQCKWAAVLREHFDVVADAFTPNTEIEAVLNTVRDDGEKIPRTSRLQAVLRRAFHNASLQRGRQQEDRQRVRGYHGIQRKQT
ncbi:MAG: bifunctional DNA primase/polymerase [Caldilineaceae bacterium]|nr:bifunctional DNA primase/polymerase [Caldilineaceae bacterium]